MSSSYRLVYAFQCLVLDIFVEIMVKGLFNIYLILKPKWYLQLFIRLCCSKKQYVFRCRFLETNG